MHGRQDGGAWTTDLVGGSGRSKARPCAPEAMRRSGLEDFGDPPIEPALSILVNSLELEADLHPLGRFDVGSLTGPTETRLRLTEAWRGQSEAFNGSFIQRPVFITGMARSGFTFLHELMVEDPQNRGPRVWEVMFPIPPQNCARSKVDPRVVRPKLVCGGSAV